ncbi:hypothetical protein [Spirochaeta isovalerica]|uniref:Outer membrane protein beta-barrel domain-containing protein n=1 Tax=Spirochaeta isovalerica TaxID=150 RepID=A0A841R8B2_9SPIO|nr:hypothetical protein [Spirochaeta isovalerica]MBB6479270.1 hypothetical protein [Spirochaeta isovalerica]
MKKVVFVLFIVVFTHYLIGQDTQKNEEKKINHIGFIFSTETLLIDLDDYNGGIGIKLVLPSINFRIMGDFGYSKSSEVISGDLGIAIEKKVRNGRITPYWGGGLQAGIIHEKAETNEDNWEKLLTVPLEANAFLGVEVFLLEFISFFAEYEVSAGISYVKNSLSTYGVIEEVSSWNWDIQTGIGNSGRLGIVIYLDDVIVIDRK